MWDDLLSCIMSVPACFVRSLLKNVRRYWTWLLPLSAMRLPINEFDRETDPVPDSESEMLIDTEPELELELLIGTENDGEELLRHCLSKRNWTASLNEESLGTSGYIRLAL